MKIINHEEFPDIKIIDNFHAEDKRGSFTKIFSENEFKKNGICFTMKETYYSCSGKDVIRGMHFQLPPYDHDKIVHVISGNVLDVVVDLRKKSPFYGKSIEIPLSAVKPQAVYIPKGFAHGFLSREENTIMLYYVSSCYHKEKDAGIHWNTIGAHWNIEHPIVSDRDNSFVSMQEFRSPF